MKEDDTAFHANPHKAAAKIRINNNLIAVSLTIFGIMWAFSPERLILPIILQFICAVPLLYVSSISYTKIAYWEHTKMWDYYGWFTGTTATAFVMNIIGILTFFLGYPNLALVYFIAIWLLLAGYTAINIYYRPHTIYEKLFKLVYFIVLQLFFGILLLF